MAIEGTGIKSPSSGSQKMAKVYYGGPEAEKRRQLKKDLDKFMKDFGGTPASDPFNPKGRGMGDRFDPTAAKPNFFSPGGGAFDERNNVQIASAGDSFDENDFKGYLKAVGIKYPRTLSDTFMRGLKENYQMDKKEGIYKDGQIFNRSDTLLNKVPVKEKPSFVEQTKNLAGSIFNAVTGTQPAAASQIPGGMPTGTQFTSSNLDAARASTGSVDTGDTSFSSFRMAGGGQQQQEGSGIVTPFSQTSMGKGEGRKVTPFSETSMGQRVSVAPTTAPKTVTIDGQTVAARQTVASLPSNYKATEAEAFRKAAAYQEAKKIAQRNPNVSVGVDSKGQPVARAVQKTRSEAGTSARTAEGNKARVQQNARARAQAAAVNRKLSGKSISQTKAANRASMKASAAARNASFQARKKAGTLSRSERTASGQRAAKKAAAKSRAKAAAKARNARKKGAPKKNRRRGRRGRRCDIFLKYNISPLTNMNLIRDDLAEVAYFVKEIQK